jgi:Tfp pilus assembly protein FimT
MRIAPIRRPTHQPEPNSPSRPKGFSLLEMMMLVTLIA